MRSEHAPRANEPRYRTDDEHAPDSPGGGEAAADAGGELEIASDAALPKRRRGSRGGRRRRARKERVQDAPLQREAGALEPASATFAEGDTVLDTDGAFESDVDAEAPAAFNEDGSPQVASDDGAHKKRRRRGRRRGRKVGAADGETPLAAADSPLAELADEELAASVEFAPVARSSFVPRELDQLPDTDGEEDGEAPQIVDESDEAGRKKRRRRGSRGGRRLREKRDATTPPSPAPSAARPSTRAARPATTRRTKDEPVVVESIPGEDDDLPELEIERVPALEPQRSEPVEGAGRSRRRKKKRTGEPAEPVQTYDDDDEPAPIPEELRNSLILVNATDPEEQRVAVVEDEQIVDFQMTVKDQDTLVNDIYRGRVVNLEPAIGAAFVDFGQGRNGFLHTSDVLSLYGDPDWSLDKLLSAQIDPEEWDGESSQPSVSSEILDADAEDGSDKRPEPSGGARAKKKQARRPAEHKRRFRARPRLPITDLLKKGQMVVVQVTKDAIGDKGPTLTTYISIPGRYLVLMPSMSRTGVSRKIEDEKERRRLKRILQALDVPAGMGIIVRTAGVGHSKAEIKRDLDYLKSAWEAFGKRLNHGHGPAPLYRESDIALRTMRDLFTPTTKAVIVDDHDVHQHIVEFAQKLMPEDVGRVKLHTGQRPLFHSHGIEADFEKIFSRRIELPSGGSIVFDQAEALVAIDVNSGRTRTDGFDFEEIALKTNLEAVPEIARQIRLRDLGGIIVADFIDMMKMGNIRAVEKAFKEALSQDRARSKIGRISQFGLLELTRQRLGPGMNRKVFHTCKNCRGTGRIRTVNSRAAAILRRLGSALTQKGFTAVEVKAHPEVVAYMRESCSEYIRALEYRFEREVRLSEAPEQVEDSVLRYLRTDGREVRPGGRRKR